MKMVSSACRGSCSTMSLKYNNRALSIDRSKDYSLPLQVETSVEYDLPSHIYPPKGSEPILMIHPSYTTRKVPVTSISPVFSSSSSNSSSSKPLSALQVNSNSQQITSRSVIKSGSQSKSVLMCSCGNPNCNQISSRNGTGRNSQPELSVLTTRQISQIPDKLSYSGVKASLQSAADVKLQQQKSLQQKVHQTQKQLGLQQKQFLLQQQQQQQIQQLQLQQQLQERAKLQVQQLQQLQQHTQQKSLNASSSSVPRQQQSNSDQIISWNVGASRCIGPCCQPRTTAGVAATVSNTPSGEFLAPGIPPSYLTRTPTRGPVAGSSPKLRARSRRGLNVANTVNLPEYLGTTTRSSRTSSVGGAAGASGAPHTRTRSSSSMLAASSTPAAAAPITAHQVASALDVVRAHVLTPRSLFSSQQLHQSTLNTATSLFSTVGQSRDSGCSVTPEVGISGNKPNSGSNTGSSSGSSSGSSNSSFTSNESGKNIEWTWSVVDSGFCTPVDGVEDQIMETYDNSASLGSYTPVTPVAVQNNNNNNNSNNAQSVSNKDSGSSTTNTTNSNLSWMREWSTPLLTSREFGTPLHSSSSSSSMSSIHNSFLPPPNPHYIPQPIWNLAY